MRYPSKKRLAEMDRRLKNVEGTKMLGSNPSAGEKFRWELCQNLTKFLRVKNISQTELADLLGIDPARVSEIVHHRIDKMSTDKLIKYNEIIDPKVQFKIA